MEITLTALHFVYLAGVIVTLACMIARKDCIIPCAVFTFLAGVVNSGSLLGGASASYNALVFAGGEFFSTILTISVMVTMAKQMGDMGTDRVLVAPLAKLSKSPMVMFLILGCAMGLVTALIWPSPAVALIGGLLTPLAVRAGLPAIGAAVAMNMFGHGFVFALDPIIQGAPGITADTAGLSSATELMSRGWPVWLIGGLVALAYSFVSFSRDLKKNKERYDAERELLLSQEVAEAEVHPMAKFMAVFTIVGFIIAVAIVMTKGLTGGDATAVINTAGIIITLVGAFIKDRFNALDTFTDFARDGFMFGMKIFTPVLFIGGFFFIGGSGIGSILSGEFEQGVLMDWAWWLSAQVPMNKIPVAIMCMVIGAITGLDGSGFSGLPLCGSMALAFGTACGLDIALLAMLGQLGAIWVGGGTCIPWAVIPVAAMCDVDPNELTRRNFLPVITGLIVSTIVAIIML